MTRSSLALLIALLSGWAIALLSGGAIAQPLQAVVPTRVVHPGQTLTAADLRVVSVRNPNPVSQPVVRKLDDALGKVSKRTLLPRRYIARTSLRVPHAIKAGEVVQLRYQRGTVLITLPATALGSAAHGQPVTVRVKGGRSVLGTVATSGIVDVAR